jgi:predicted secreted Zn-dependent protease
VATIALSNRLVQSHWHIPFANFGQRLRIGSFGPSFVVLALILFSLFRLGASPFASANSGRPVTASGAVVLVKKKVAHSQQGAASGSVTPSILTVSTPQIIPTPTSCTPDTYTPPSALDLANAQPGLTQTVDAPSQYQIYGYSSSQIESQIRQCAPNVSSTAASAEFAAETEYRLNWQYDVVVNGAGQCSLSNVKVGSHISMVVPLWRPSQYAAAGLAQQWQSFATGLLTHEDGHVVIDKQYAATLLADLQAFPATDCSSIGQLVTYLVNADVGVLNQANDNYDAATNHGATQGAILP